MPDTTPRFHGKAALVTGGSRGLGKAITLRLAAEGCNVAIGYLTSRNEANAVVEECLQLGAEAIALRGNVARSSHLERMVSRAAEAFGGLDFFISNAASGVLKPALELTDEDWDLGMNAIARALLAGARSCVPYFEKRGGGRIIGMASMGADRVLPDYAAIGAAKAAMETAIKYLAHELFEKNIIVNAVSAGVTDTRSLAGFPKYRQVVEGAVAGTPGGRLTDPDDVAAVAAFLCSEDARWIVGQTIMVDGGLTLSV